jgi:hypothetical protein
MLINYTKRVERVLGKYKEYNKNEMLKLFLETDINIQLP